MYPVKLEIKNTVSESIKFIKDSLRRIPNKGLGFGSFAEVRKNSFTTSQLPLVIFNYLGQFDTKEIVCGSCQIIILVFKCTS